MPNMIIINSPAKCNSPATASTTTTIERGVWSAHEHDQFLAALKLYPDGPWRAIADVVGTRSARQVQTHAQKYYEKVARRVRGLRKDRRRVARDEHRLDADMAELCMSVEGDEDAAAVALTANTRRGLNIIAMRVHSVSPSSPSSPVLEDDMKVEAMQLSEDDDSDSSLSALDDDCLSYLLQILESREYETADEHLWGFTS